MDHKERKLDRSDQLLKRLEEWFALYPIRFIIGIVILTFVVYVIIGAIGQSVWWDWDKKLVIKPLTSHLVNFIGILGAVLTVSGILFTWRQLRIANDRIIGYRQLYRWVDTFIREVQENKGSKFYFYGSTVLPGNISHTDERDIGDYRELVLDLVSGKGTFKNVEDIHFVLPTEGLCEKNYKWFSGVRIWGIRKRTQTEWEDHINEKLQDAIKVQKRIEFFTSESKKPKLTTVSEGDVAALIKHAYVWLSDTRVIYALPLHYYDKPNSSDGSNSEVVTELHPALVGFTSTSHEIVRAFEEQFYGVSVPSTVSSV